MLANQEGRITYVNKGAEKIFGYTADYLQGRSLTLLMPERYHDAHSHGLKRYLSTGETRVIGRTVELAGRRKDGTEFPLELSLAAWPADGKIIFMSILRDVTERRDFEERERILHQELLQSEKMRALGEILSGAAHELNNPLTAILGYSQLIMQSPSLEESKADLWAICVEAKRCSAIVQNLVAFARKRGPQREPCELNRVIRETLKLRGYQMAVADIEVVTRLDESIPRTMADPYQLQQVFLNIINNAVQAMEKSTRRRLTVTSRMGEETAVILFEDSGPGIPPKYIHKIFEPFFTTKESVAGTGLGLSLCYGIITEHGGKIRVESPEGMGAMFVIELPVIPPPPVRELIPDEPPSAASEAGRGNILVVDDEKPCRDVFKRYFGRNGYVVSAVGSVDEAVGLLREQKFDLIVSDHKMPGKGGEYLYEHVRNHYPDLAGKFVVVTGDPLDSSYMKFIERTHVGVIEKPFDLQALGDRVRELLKTP